MAENNVLYYDGDCPFCRRYADYLRLRKKFGLTLKNAREEPEAIAALRAQGFEINDGMILVLEGKIYQGAKALAVLEKSLNPTLIRMFYPILKVLRRPLLKLLRKRDRL